MARLATQPVPSLDVLQLTAQQLADHLTALEFGLFASVAPWEWMNQLWRKSSKHPRLGSPHLSQLANRFNLISRWVSAQILLSKDEKERNKVLKLFIGTAAKLES